MLVITKDTWEKLVKGKQNVCTVTYDTSGFIIPFEIRKLYANLLNFLADNKVRFLVDNDPDTHVPYIGLYSPIMVNGAEHKQIHLVRATCSVC